MQENSEESTDDEEWDRIEAPHLDSLASRAHECAVHEFQEEYQREMGQMKSALETIH